jgi:hypothetical protein
VAPTFAVGLGAILDEGLAIGVSVGVGVDAGWTERDEETIDVPIIPIPTPMIKRNTRDFQVKSNDRRFGAVCMSTPAGGSGAAGCVTGF